MADSKGDPDPARLGDVLRNIMENTSAHGLPNINRAPNALRRAFWSLLFAWALGMFLWQCYELIHAYFQWEVDVNINIQYKSELDFPAVSICNLNPIKTSSIRYNDRLKALLGSGEEATSVGVATATSAPFLATATAGAGDAFGGVVTVSYVDDPVPVAAAAALQGTTGAPATKQTPTAEGAPTTDVPVTASTAPTQTAGDGAPSSAGTGGATKPSAQSPAPNPGPNSQAPQAATPPVGSPPEGGVSKTGTRRRKRQTAESTARVYQDWDNINYMSKNDKLDFFDQVGDALALTRYADRRGLGHEIDDILLACTFKGYPCGPSNFTYFYNYLYGNCFTFNSGTDGDVKTSSKSGPLYGLTLELNVEETEYVPDVQEAAGMRVVIGEQYRMAFPEDAGINVAPGLLTSIGVRRVELERQPFPYGNCTEQGSTTATDNIFSSFFGVNYSLEVCQKDCLYNSVLEMCLCADPRFKFTAEVQPCLSTNSTQVSCQENVERLYADNEIECNCTSPCLESSFELTVSSAAWPNTLYEESVRQDLLDISDVFRNKVASDQDFVENNVLKLQVYYEQLNYEKVTQTPKYDEFGLISNLGGQVGLWIGISMCTVFEFVELLYDVCKILALKCLSVGHARKATAPSSVEVELRA